MKYSVVVCTRNRAASLTRTLESLAKLEPPRRGSWRLVVVDNASSDDTPRVIESFRERLPLTPHVAPEPGISNARNVGALAGVEGADYLLWTDDDITVPPGWLRAYESGIDANPGAAFFGGPVRPHFEGTPPGWVRQGWPIVSTCFGLIDLSLAELSLDTRSRRLPFGANMAIRAAEQRDFLYDPELGRRPGPMILSGEETDVLERIARAGGKGVWLPETSVLHWVLPERQTVGYVRRYYFGIGYLGAKRAATRKRPTSWSRRLRLRRRLAQYRAVYVLGRASGSTTAWVRALRRSALTQGRLLAHREANAAGSRDPIA